MKTVLIPSAAVLGVVTFAKLEHTLNIVLILVSIGYAISKWIWDAPKRKKKREDKRQARFPFVLLLAVAVLMCGCNAGLRAKGGKILHAPGMSQTTQPENAKDGAEQKTETHRNIEVPLPAGSEIKFLRVEAGVSNLVTVKLSEPSTYRDFASDNRQSKVGGSQVDTVGAIVAKLKSARWMTILGALLCVGGLACAFVPYLSAILGGMTPGLAMSGGGVVIAALPYVIIGNERFLIGGGLVCALATIAAIFLYRHGGKSAALKILTAKPNP